MTRPLPRPRLPSTMAMVEVLGQRRVLQAVIHDDDAGRVRHRLDGPGPGSAVAGDQCRRRAREQQGLVAHVVGRVCIADPMRSGVPPAIAAGERNGMLASRLQTFAQVHHQRCLAGAAGGEIAGADHRQPGAIGLGPRIARGRGPAVNGGERRQAGRHSAGAIAIPPGRLVKRHARNRRRPAGGAAGPPPCGARHPRGRTSAAVGARAHAAALGLVGQQPASSRGKLRRGPHDDAPRVG